MRRKRAFWGVLLVLGIVLHAGVVLAVSTHASEDLLVRIGNDELGPGMTAQTPQLLLERRGQRFPLDVIEYRSGEDGEVVCRLPAGLKAGNYSLLVRKNGEWIELDTPVKVFAPVVNRVGVSGGRIRKGALVSLKGLFFSKTPEVFIRYKAITSTGEKELVQRCPLVAPLPEYSPMDTSTGESAVRVRIPSLGKAAPETCVFEIRNEHGRARAYFREGLAADIGNRGQLVSATLQNTLNTKEIWSYLVKSLAGDSLFKQIISAGVLIFTELRNQHYVFNLQQWNISYWTVDEAGNSVLASGVVIIPPGAKQPSLLSFQHGTMMTKKEAPTLSEGPELGFATTFAAADGYVISMPDHLGLGQAAYQTQRDLLHPYCQAEPLAMAAADMMLAVKQFLVQQFPAMQIRNQLFLAGYSEGGYATMALHRELDTSTYDLPPVFASACMDGPYSLSKVMVDKLTADAAFPVLYFAPYILVAMDRTYNLYDSASDYMAFPYDMTVSPLINGYFSSDMVNEQMPPSGKPRDALTPTVLAELQSYSGKIFGALATNDLVPAPISPGAWSPTADVTLFHGERDDCVPFGNSTAAMSYFTGVGAPNVKLDPFDTVFADIPGLTTHVIYCPFAMGMAWDWFHGLLSSN